MPYAASIDEIQRPNLLPHLYLVLVLPFIVAAAIYLDLAVGGVRNHTLPELMLSYFFLVVFTS